MKLHHSIILASAVALSLPLNVEAGEAKRVNGNVVEYNDGLFVDNNANSPNEVTVGFASNGHFIVTDVDDVVKVGVGCILINSHTADCGATAVARVKMDLAGGNDVAGPLVASSEIPLEINGGDGADRLTGSYARDTLRGGNGNDNLFGSRGGDTIYGDGNRDTITGGTGEDTIFGGDGNDVIDGGKHDDTIHGDSGNDTITGERGKDKMFGDLGNDTLLADDNEKDTVDGGLFENDRCDVDSGFLDTVSNCEQIDG